MTTKATVVFFIVGDETNRMKIVDVNCPSNGNVKTAVLGDKRLDNKGQVGIWELLDPVDNTWGLMEDTKPPNLKDGVITVRLTMSGDEIEEFRQYKRAKTAPELFVSSLVYYSDQYSFVISQTSKLKNAIPGEYVGPAAVYNTAVDSSDKNMFMTNFIDTLKNPTNDEFSPFKLSSIWWGQSLQRVAEQLAHNIYLIEKGELHCSNVLVGMMGVGKTTIVKYVAILATILSNKLVSVYIDITSIDESPLDIVRKAIVTAGLMDASSIRDIGDVAAFILKNDMRLLIIFDEAHKFYANKGATSTQIAESKRRIRQLYTLGISRNCMVILCGSSSKLPVLALRDECTKSARDLLASYPDYDSLNHSKFSSVALNALQWTEMPEVINYLKRPADDALPCWKKTGGSMRYIRKDKELPPKIPKAGAEMLVLDYLASQQPDAASTDATLLVTVTIEHLQQAIMTWEVEGITVERNIIYEMIDQSYLSSVYEADVVSALGFSHPAQYSTLLATYSLPTQLTKQQREMLTDPKVFGERLEMFVQSCIHKEILPYVVLCMDNQASSVKEQHTDIMLDDWEPLGEHKDLKVFKVSPDACGIDTLTIISYETAQNPTTKKRTDSVTIEKFQVKLGGSSMSIGTNDKKKEKAEKAEITKKGKNAENAEKSKKGKGAEKSKADTVAHAVQRSQLSGIDEAVKKAFCAAEVKSSIVFLVTRKLSANARALFQQHGELRDGAYLSENVWPLSVIEHAKSVPIPWILGK